MARVQEEPQREGEQGGGEKVSEAVAGTGRLLVDLKTVIAAATRNSSSLIWLRKEGVEAIGMRER